MGTQANIKTDKRLFLSRIEVIDSYTRLFLNDLEQLVCNYCTNDV